MTGKDKAQLKVAYFAAGCFWCLEAQFQHLPGVVSIKPGFMGGLLEFPTYEEVHKGNTGHAETCKITYDPANISFEKLLLAFFNSHDPTQLNRQGNDIGTQYRSAFFYQNEEEKEQIETCIKKLEAASVYDQPIVTEVSPADIFYPAEDYHSNYYNQHGDNPYCDLVVKPKVKKFLKYLANENSTILKQ